MSTATRQRRLFLILIAVAAAMFGFGYVLPPLYAKVCQLTGFNRLQSADTVSGIQQDSNRKVLMQFDSNLRDDLPWNFRATQATASIHLGQLAHVSYEVSNNSDHAISGQ